MQLRVWLFLLCFLSCFPAEARADTSIAVVDVQALLSQSDAAKSIDKQADERKDKFRADLAKQEQELRDSETKLTAARASISKEEFAARARQFEEKLIELRRSAQTKKRAYDEASGKALNQLREKLYEVVQQIAKEKQYNLVISKQNVIVGEQSIDITDEAMKRLNSTISNIPLDIADQ